MTYRYLTEDEIERRVEKMVDHLDRVFMNGDMTQKNYDLAMLNLHDWAERQYEILGRTWEDTYGD